MRQPIHEHSSVEDTAFDESVCDRVSPEIPPNESEAAALNDLSVTTDVKTLVQNALERYQQMMLGHVPARGLSTGFSHFDEMTNGLEPGRVYVIASRPSMGKTSLLLQILTEICLKQQIPSLLFTGDLSITEVIDRLVFNRAKRPLIVFADPAYRPSISEMTRIVTSSKELAASGLILDGNHDLTIEAISDKAREERIKNLIGLIVIDHLHLIRSEATPPGTARKHEMFSVVHELRNLARELGLPILVLMFAN